MTEAELSEIATWLQRIGYGVDFVNADNPVPESLRHPLAQAWFNADSYEGSGLTVDDYERMLKDEGSW